MNIRVLYLTLFTIPLFNFANAQTGGGKISGSVLDEAKKPLYGATLSLLVAKDSALAGTQLANQDGSFAFCYVAQRHAECCYSKENIE